MKISRPNKTYIALGVFAVACAFAAAQAAVDKFTHEVRTDKGTKTVIVDGGIWDAVMHPDGVLLPGASRISNGAKTVDIVDHYKGAGIGLIGSVKAKDGEFVNPNFEFDYEVINPKLLVDKFSIHWKLDHLWGLIESCIAELITEHDAGYFKNPVDKRAIGLELESKVKLALEREGMPISVSNTILFTGPYGGRLRPMYQGRFEKKPWERRTPAW